MAKINMDDIKKDTVNSTQIDGLETNEQAEANKQPAELINNASETPEDTNEIDKETEAKDEDKASGKVVVRYVGGGIWKDSKGNLWASENKSATILNERQYSADEYENREDIKFMVRYGAMKETYVK